MSDYSVHYPNFDVLHEEKHWDSHTREIIEKRLKTESFYPYQFFTGQEVKTLARLCSVLLDEQRASVIAFVVHHFDSTIKASLGESQRKIGVPKQSVLIRQGLALLNQVCAENYGGKFSTLEEKIQNLVVTNWIKGNFTLQSNPKNVPVNDFMDKILSESVAAYYSHPSIWSEIGYAGPAYPRGYVRSELGLTDPWEASRDGE